MDMLDDGSQWMLDGHRLVGCIAMCNKFNVPGLVN